MKVDPRLILILILNWYLTPLRQCKAQGAHLAIDLSVFFALTENSHFLRSNPPIPLSFGNQFVCTENSQFLLFLVNQIVFKTHWWGKFPQPSSFLRGRTCLGEGEREQARELAAESCQSHVSLGKKLARTEDKTKKDRSCSLVRILQRRSFGELLSLWRVCFRRVFRELSKSLLS